MATCDKCGKKIKIFDSIHLEIGGKELEVCGDCNTKIEKEKKRNKEKEKQFELKQLYKEENYILDKNGNPIVQLVKLKNPILVGIQIAIGFVIVSAILWLIFFLIFGISLFIS
ncbi:hypothetical protein K8R47_04195 [archaeon]|nr:hypothetical protein [archaeon]